LDKDEEDMLLEGVDDDEEDSESPPHSLGLHFIYICLSLFFY